MRPTASVPIYKDSVPLMRGSMTHGSNPSRKIISDFAYEHEIVCFVRPNVIIELCER
jgi:hypothetical protein